VGYTGQNIFTKAYNKIKNIVVYQEPQTPSRFVLGEDNEQAQGGNNASNEAVKQASQLESLLYHARQLEESLANAIKIIRAGDWDQLKDLARQTQLLSREQADLNPIRLSYDGSCQKLEGLPVQYTLVENRNILIELFSLPDNKDVVIREFNLPTSPSTPAMIAFMEGLIDKKIIDMVVLGPLMLAVSQNPSALGEDRVSGLANHYLLTNQAKQAATFQDVENGITSGDTVLFIQGAKTALVLETKGWEHRSVGTPRIEQSIRGAQAAFTETLRVNTGLIRAAMHTSDLVTEMVEVGNRSKSLCAIMYLKSVANTQIVAEVKRRIGSIKIDYVADIGILEQLIVDHPILPIPQTLSTERVDRVPIHLAEGRVAILLEGSCFVLVVPIGYLTLFHSIDDYSLTPIPASFMRIIRLVGTVLTAVLPAFYLAISYFHSEAIPTDLLLSISGSRERVPFPVIFEILLMEMSFELIREAGTRVPGLLGSTIGIVGAIIIGQAAVAANIVSPIMVVVIALTGLASFTIPDFRMSFGVRVGRFAFLLAAATFGLVGIAAGLYIVTLVLCYMKSFGVPFMVPIAPKTAPGWDIVMRGPIHMQEQRPDELNTQDTTRQPNISRRWIENKPPNRKGD
jgi:spore germination protein KA